MSMIVNPEKDSSADEAAFNETRKALIEAWNEYRYNKKISESVKETNKMMSDKNFRLLLSRIAEEHEKLADQRTRLACGR